MTIEDAIKLALEEARVENSSTSQHTYTWHARTILEKWPASTALTSITRLKVQEWCNEMKAAGLKPSTVRHKLAFLNRAFRKARDHGVEVARPTTDLRLPKINNQRKDYAGLAKLEQLRPYERPWRFSIYSLAFLTGLRRFELYRLEVDDIEIMLEEFEIQGKKVWVEVGTAHVKDSKTGLSRIVALNVEATQIVKQWIEIAKARNSEYLLGPYHGSRFARANALSRALRDAARKAGVKVSMHLFRHGFATEATKNGAKSEHVRMQLGHKSLTQTARYQHNDKTIMWPAVFAVSRMARSR